MGFNHRFVIQVLVIPTYYSSFSSVSVRCRRAFSFKRRLTDTYDLGNLPKVGTGFVGIHGSLRKIPEGDEKYGRLSAPYFSIVRE